VRASLDSAWIKVLASPKLLEYKRLNSAAKDLMFWGMSIGFNPQEAMASAEDRGLSGGHNPNIYGG
jgi:hypothetical protein